MDLRVRFHGRGAVTAIEPSPTWTLRTLTSE
jgi:hypothetical protein